MKKETNKGFYFYGYWVLISLLAIIGVMGVIKYFLYGSFY
jgi:uncharacterized membrane protein